MVKQKIFETTLDLVNQYGTLVSVRKISKAANVNVASINYHYGSKDNLINEIIIYKLELFKAAFDLLASEEIDEFERLELFLCKLVDLIDANPEVADYVIDQHDLFKTRYEYQNYLEVVGYRKLVQLIKQITGNEDEAYITIIIEHLLSASVLSYMSQLSIATQNTNFLQDQNQKDTIHIFIENYFYRYMKKEGN